MRPLPAQREAVVTGAWTPAEVVALQRAAGNAAIAGRLTTVQRQEVPRPEDAAGRAARLINAFGSERSNEKRDEVLRACMAAAGRYDAVGKALEFLKPGTTVAAAVSAAGMSDADGARVYSYLRFGPSLRLADKLFFAGIGAGTDKETLWRLLPLVRQDLAKTSGEFSDSYGSAGPTAYKNAYTKDGTLADGTQNRIAGFLEEEADDEPERAKFMALLAFGELRAADEIHIAIRSVHALAGSLMAALTKAASNTGPGTKPTIEADYKATYKRDLIPILEAELGVKSDDYAKARLILSGDYTAKKRIQFACEGVGTSMKEIWSALEDARKGGQLEPLRKEWSEGGEIKTWIDGELVITDADKKKIAAILEDKGDMDSRLVQLGLTVDDTNEVLKAAMERQDVNASFAAEWKNTGGAFYKAFTQEGKRGVVWGDLIVNGTVLQRLDLAATTLRSEDAVLAILARPDVDDAARTTIRSDHLLLKALQQMDAWPRIEPLVQPRDDIKARAEWMKRKFDTEATSGLGLAGTSAAAYAFDDEARELDVALGKAKDPDHLTDEERRTLAPKAKSAEDALAAFIRVRDELDAVAVQVIGAVLGLLATVATGGAAGPVVAGMVARAALAQGVASVAAVWMVKGERVTGAEAARAFAVGTVSGATGALLPSPIMSALSPAYKEAVRTGTIQVAEQVAAKEFSTVGLGVMKGTLEGAGSGAAGGLVDAASRGDTWKYGFVEGLKSTLADGLRAGTSGAVTGGAIQLIRLSLFGSKPGAKPPQPGAPPEPAPAPAALDRATIDRARAVLDGEGALTMDRWTSEILPQLGGDATVARQALVAARKELVDAAVARAQQKLTGRGVQVKVTHPPGLDGVVDLEFVPIDGSPLASQPAEAKAATLRSAAEQVGAELGQGAESRLNLRLRAAGAEAVGGVRGPDVYGKREMLMTDAKLADVIKKEVLAKAPATEGWAVKGTTFTEVAGAPLTYELNVPAPAPMAGAGPGVATKVTVKVVRVKSTAMSTDAHPTAGGGSLAGPGRVRLSKSTAGGDWTGTIDIDPQLEPDFVRFVVGHELDEMSRIIRTNPASQADIDAQMRPAVFTQEPPILSGGSPRATAHDHAAAVELFDLQRALRTASGSKKAALEASAKKLISYMGLEDSTNLGAKLAVLEQYADFPEAVKFVEALRERAGRQTTFQAFGGVGIPAGSGLATNPSLVQHLALPEATRAGDFLTKGIGGGHDQATLLSWVANSGNGYGLRMMGQKSGAGFIVTAYEQYRWTGGGEPPPFPGTANPPGWQLATGPGAGGTGFLPKTAIDNLPAFLKAVDDELAKLPATRWKGVPKADIPLSLGGVGVMLHVKDGVVTTVYAQWP